MFKKKLLRLTPIMLVAVLVSWSAVWAETGTNSCGYIMEVMPLPATATSIQMADDQPMILGAWTTHNPQGDPFSQVTDFTRFQDTLAFVVHYHHTGGSLPTQFARGWVCGDETRIVKDCNFTWLIPFLPAGDYLLINYFNNVAFGVGVYDWAVKVGNVVYGWPNISTSLPQCINIHP